MHIHAKLGQENLLRMVRWVRWHCSSDTGFEIRTLEVWGRVRYLSVTEAPHNTEFCEWMGRKHLCFFQTGETGKRTPNSGVKGSGANHYPRAPAQLAKRNILQYTFIWRGINFRAFSYSYSQRNTVHYIVFRELWAWILKGVTAAVHLTVVVWSLCVIVTLTCESLSPRIYI